MLRKIIFSLYSTDVNTNHWTKLGRFIGALEVLAVAPKQEYCKMVNECHKTQSPA